MKRLFKIFGVIGAFFIGIFGFSKIVSADSAYSSDGYSFIITLNGVSVSGESAKYYCYRYYKDSNDSPIYSFRFLLDSYEDSYTMYFGCVFIGGYYGTAQLIDSNVLFNMFTLNFNGSGETYSVVDYYFSNPIISDGYLYIKVDSSESSNDLSISKIIPSSIVDGATYSDGYSVGYNDASNYYNTYYSNLESDYSSLQTTYNTLNNNYTSLQTTYNTLVTNYSTLQQQYNDLLSEQYSFSSLFWSISAVPFGVLGSMLNFEVLGINLFGLVTGILTAGLVIWLIKHFIIK